MSWRRKMSVIVTKPSAGGFAAYENAARAPKDLSWIKYRRGCAVPLILVK
jgi:hypothetical protein